MHRNFDNNKLQNLFQNRDSLVECRKFIVVNNAELNIFETVDQNYSFPLQFDNLCLAFMISGKKIMEVNNSGPFDFLPGQSMVLSSGSQLKIDFPEASMENPTTCVAMQIDRSFLNNLVAEINNNYRRFDYKEWNLSPESFLVLNDTFLNTSIVQFMDLILENYKEKDEFMSRRLYEVVLRLMQLESRNVLLENVDQNYSTTNRLQYITQYISDNIQSKLSIEKLSEIAGMSQSTFFKLFKNELGVTPVHFVNRMRVKKAQKLLKESQYNISEICYECGFSDVFYFSRIFKKITGHSPTEYRMQFKLFGSDQSFKTDYKKQSPD